nr:hypothetical transcript [Hymenolepis microstoma]
MRRLIELGDIAEKTKNQALEKVLRDAETKETLGQKVFEYETAHDLNQAPSHQASGGASPTLSKPMNHKKGNSIRMACQTYQCGPKGAMVPHLQRQLAHEILEEATLERKQEKRSSSK